jgi:1-deoxy-D-xylulose-5-phosphate reductoisomerase
MASLNAANEVAVEAFLAQSIAFTSIPRILAQVQEQIDVAEPDTLDVVKEADQQARQLAQALIGETE